MGLISKAFDSVKARLTKYIYADVLNGRTPIFSQFGQDIYASDVVVQAVSCIVSEMKKLKPEHVREKDGEQTTVRSSLNKVLNNPNHIMTASEFIEKVTWSLFLHSNAFVIPVYYAWNDNKGTEHREYKALYPIQPSRVDFIEDGEGALYVKFRFAKGVEYTVRYSDVIHIRENYSVNEYMGGDEEGNANHRALLKTLNMNHIMMQGVIKALKANCAINAVVKTKTIMDKEKAEAEIRELEEKLANNESGFLHLDIMGEFIPIKKEMQIINPNLLKFIDEKILRHFGVPLPILTGDFTKTQYEAFYQKRLEPLIISYSQAFTKGLFTENEISHGNKIAFYAKDLYFMSIEQKIALVKELGPSGGLLENEKRIMFGMRPLEELRGKRFMSLNWIDSGIADQYQMGRMKGDKPQEGDEADGENV